MIIYKDVFTQDELFSDTYPMELIHNCMWKVKGKQIQISTDDDSIDIGANPSAEGGEEGTDANVVSGVNVVLANRLVETNIGKKDYMAHIKEYMKRVKTHLVEGKSPECDSFQKDAQTAVKAVLGEFKEYQFFMGEKMDAEGMLVLMKWDEETPYLYFFKHGMEAEKV